MSQNTVLESQGDVPPESASRTVPSALTTTVSSSTTSSSSSTTAVDPVRSLAEAWYRHPDAFSVPVPRLFDAQYWACWLVAVVFPILVGYLLLTR